MFWNSIYLIRGVFHNENILFQERALFKVGWQKYKNVDESLLLKVEPCSLCRRSQRLEEKTARSQNLHLFLSPLSRPHMRVTINKKVNNCGLSKESDGSNWLLNILSPDGQTSPVCHNSQTALDNIRRFACLCWTWFESVSDTGQHSAGSKSGDWRRSFWKRITSPGITNYSTPGAEWSEICVRPKRCELANELNLPENTIKVFLLYFGWSRLCWCWCNENQGNLLS